MHVVGSRGVCALFDGSSMIPFWLLTHIIQNQDIAVWVPMYPRKIFFFCLNPCYILKLITFLVIPVLWTELCTLPNLYVKVLTLSTLECDLELIL
jgi:hypothetical protein